jgi:aspartate aminotransferase
VIVVDSMSKTYSACGLRIGFFISRNADLMEKVERIGQARLGAQPLAQTAAIAALGMDEGYYDDIRHIYRARVHALTDALSSVPGATVPRPEGAFYSMVELPIDDADRFARWLVEEFREGGESVVVAPGPGFYASPASGRSQVRLAAVLEQPLVRRAGDLLARALDLYPGRTDR